MEASMTTNGFPKHESPLARRDRRGAAALPAALLAAGALLLASAVPVSAAETKGKPAAPAKPPAESDDPAAYKDAFPLQYESYMKTVDQVRTRFGGSEALPRSPTSVDPRSVISKSRLEDDPRLKTIWAGYPFSKDFRERRGHAWMLDDQTYTGRQEGVQQPGTCLNCHASVLLSQRKLGGGDLAKGFDAMNSLPFAEARKLVSHPVSCIDCHDPQTFELRVVRTAFIEGLKGARAASGLKDWDISKASSQQKRTFVCAQCHVEYFFKGPEKRLTLPWAKGLKVEQMLSYYDDAKFSDWTHAETGAGVLKVQHPEFELYSQGIHARSGVSCVDCHMPSVKSAGAEYTDHWVRSPLLNVKGSCQACHAWDEAELKDRVDEIQGRVFQVRNVAIDALVDLIGDLKGARAAGRTDADLAAARAAQRRAQFFVDMVEAENSTGFHAPDESLRILSLSIDATRRGQLSLRGGSPPAK
jgi:nitrite reductase (cytochrome c-552)